MRMRRMAERPIDPPEEREVFCPVCSESCERLYVDADNNIVGCDCCISIKSAFDYLDEQEERWI